MVFSLICQLLRFWVKDAILMTVRFFTGSKFYGPIEFFLTVMAMDMLAPEYGKHSLTEYFTDLYSANDTASNCSDSP
jgi:hypothetical protein